MGRLSKRYLWRIVGAVRPQRPRLTRTETVSTGFDVDTESAVAPPERYCLLLRTAGRRGEVVLPVLPGWSSRTLEQVIAGAVDEQLGLVVRAIADRGTLFGDRPRTAADDRWQAVARRFIRRAEAIVILFRPVSRADAARILACDGDPRLVGDLITHGLAWEIGQIVAADTANRTMLVLPPAEVGGPARRAACRQAAIVLTVLQGDGVVRDDRLADLNWGRVVGLEKMLGDTALITRTTSRHTIETTMLNTDAPDAGRSITAVGTYAEPLKGHLFDIALDLL